MTPRIFHGEFSPEDVARDLISFFHRGNYQVQRIGTPDNLAVQIATRRNLTSGGATALTVSLQKVADGVSVQLSDQAWFGLAASLGKTALSALRNPWSLIGRIDDIAQEIDDLMESIKLDHMDEPRNIEIIALEQALDHATRAIKKFNWIKRPY